MAKNIGIIGFGNMGSAIGERLKSNYQVFVFDKDKNKTSNLKGINVVNNTTDLIKQVDAVILAVKPQDFEAVLNEIKHYVKEKLIISIAAGITTGNIEKALGKAKVIRAMPNICAKIGKAESSLCKGKYAKDTDLDFAKKLFDYLGKTWIMNEKMIDAATAIAGSGPAYIYYNMEINKYDSKNLPALVQQYYIERLAEAGKEVGFNAQTALDLASTTTTSSISLSAVSGIPPAELRKQITSKGGTTAAAIEIFQKSRSRKPNKKVWINAVKAALRRAKELSREE